MPRYIDAEKISDLFDVEYKSTKKLIEQGETHLNNLAEGFFEAYLVTQKMPAADVQEVIYCKNCKNYCKFENGAVVCEEFGGYIKDTDFCSRGTRKER